ncbi:MAG: tRNA dihydrouridine(20/20a) synthase DusA [Alphaproteobacteria bacterium]|nr:tRNA dihydrouridine(20/20a) synthase DusA [Alphaproteobacteria bacterium]
MHNPPVISVAPMMDWTDRHCRYFHRLLSPGVRLYTEMVTAPAILHGDRDRLLGFDPAEHPVALQIGGSDPMELGAAVEVAERYGYDEINLNCGCPSDRVQKGRFGACLMAEPDLVARCVERMRKAASVPVTVKCRIGIDEHDSFEFLDNFVRTVRNAGCETFIVHARKAWLSGLSPKENREIPPLDRERVAALRRAHPGLAVHINGGIRTLAEVRELSSRFDGVMIGREAYQNPWILAEIEKEIHRGIPPGSREIVALTMIPYAVRMATERGTPVKSITRHMLGLFQGQRRARAWRRLLSTEAPKPGATPEIIAKALQEMIC